MSAAQDTSSRYFVVGATNGYNPRAFIVVDSRDYGRGTVDWYQGHSAAEYAARSLNAGVAHVDRHAIVGCKVVAS